MENKNSKHCTMTKANFQKSRSDEPLYFSTFLVEAITKNNNKKIQLL